MVAAVALGALAVVLGLVISFHHGTAGGATIAGLAVGQFFVVLAVQEARRALRQRVSRLAT
jgi:manganese/iron transport system permease protein